MIDLVYLGIIIMVLFGLELFYFRVADRYNIIDKPNERSSHSIITLRGGGIIFPLAWLLFFLLSGFQLTWITLGACLLAVISLADDIMTISGKWRFLIHLLAFTLCFMQLGFFESLPWYGLVALYIVCIGCVNAINFMDGINGMTGLYALSVFIPIGLFLHKGGASEVFNNPIFYLIASLLVFGFFNFRKKAKCFAGDVGSVTIGYFIIYFLLLLIFKFDKAEKVFVEINVANTTWNVEFIMMLALYGVDSILTIIQRLWGKENIFKPHRKHLYQYLANELKWPHLSVSGMYASLQLMMNFTLLSNLFTGNIWLMVLSLQIMIYIALKYYILQTKIKE